MSNQLRSIAQAINNARPPLDEIDKPIVAALYKLLGRGDPVTDSELSGVTGLAEEDIVERVREWPGIYRDENGRVIGFWGLTIVEMPPHVITLRGRELWAWCAWDTLFLSRRLEASLDVRSVCPATGRGIFLRVSPDAVECVEPSGVVVSFVEPSRPFDADVIVSFCHYVHFLADREAGAEWTAKHPGTFLLSLAEAFELGRLTEDDLREDSRFSWAPGPTRR